MRVAREQSAGWVSDFLEEAPLLAPHTVAGAVDRHARSVGLAGCTVYLADLQQRVLTPLLGADHGARRAEPLSVDATLAGRCYQSGTPVGQQHPDGDAETLWLPLDDGHARLGVLALTCPDGTVRDEGVRREHVLFSRLVSMVVARAATAGDTLVRLRRRHTLGLASEMQWAQLPPLTFTSPRLDIAAALEPTYTVAGDSVGYAVDEGVLRFAILDSMGHGLESARLATLAVAAYRNARRADHDLARTAVEVDLAVHESYAGESYVTGVLAELDTGTGLLRYVNAGHPPMLVCRDGKAVRQLGSDPVLPLGLRAGLEPGAPPPVPQTEQLEPGDSVFGHTDGLTDARTPHGGFYGPARMTQQLARSLADGLSAAETLRRMVLSLLSFQGEELTDDATLVLVTWRGPDRTGGAGEVPRPRGHGSG